MSKTKNITKELQCLYAWAEFYRQNCQWWNYFTTQEQILDFKEKHGID